MSQSDKVPRRIESVRRAAESGALDDAERLCRELIDGCPAGAAAHAEASVALADILLRKGDAAAAFKAAHQAASSGAPALDVLSVLAPAAIATDARHEAGQCMAQFQRLAPQQQARILMYWAERLEDLYMFAHAASVLQPLADSPQADYDVLVFQAQLLLKAHRADAADAPLARAVRMDPERVGAHLARVRQRIQLGRIEDAVASALAVLARDAASTPAAAMLSEIAPERLPEAAVAALEATLDDADADLESRAAAGLAMGRLLETRGDHERAFDAFAAGNRALKRRAARRGHDYDHESVEASVDALQKTFLDRIDATGDDGIGLAFIVGMPRSGTTLLDRILAAHRQVVSVGEHAMMPAIAERAGTECGDSRQFEAGLAASADRWRSQYLSSLPHKPGADRMIVDKLPLNFWNVGLIARLFPRAVIIHACRDPRDVGLSSFRLRFPDAFRYVNDFNDFAHYYAQHSRLMAHWLTVVPGSILRIDYEQVVDSIEPSVRRLLDACGLPWDPACLKFSENREAVYTLSMGQVRRELYRDATRRWRRYGDRLADLERALEDSGVELPPA
ncbi:MAG: hypothetical protein CMP07_03675 [Xanthomonadales bacterium]|nr:hypothetical protein [Xanthomonadales bacterium]